jgi:molecular chaperone GrpE (heat shock protein)
MLTNNNLNKRNKDEIRDIKNYIMRNFAIEILYLIT